MAAKVSCLTHVTTNKKLENLYKKEEFIQMVSKQRVIYLINSLDPGGAELGLEKLIYKGLFDNLDLTLVCLTRSNSDLEKRMILRFKQKIIFLSEKEINNKLLLIYALKFWSYIRKNNVDIIISSLTQSVLVARLVRLFKNYKLITFEHNVAFQNRSAYILSKYTDFCTDKFWCDSEATQKSLSERIGMKVQSQNLCRLVPLFFVDTLTSPKQNYIINQKVRIVMVGRLVPQKNHYECINIINTLLRRKNNIEITFFGDGPCREDLELYVKKLNLEDAILFAGFQYDWKEKIRDYDLFLSYSNFEGLSIATLEAMSLGIPCVVKPVGELCNYIVDGKTGFFIQDLNDAVKVIEELSRNIEKREKVGKNGRLYILKNHSEAQFLSLLNNAKEDIGGVCEANKN